MLKNDMQFNEVLKYFIELCSTASTNIYVKVQNFEFKFFIEKYNTPEMYCYCTYNDEMYFFYNKKNSRMHMHLTSHKYYAEYTCYRLDIFKNGKQNIHDNGFISIINYNLSSDYLFNKSIAEPDYFGEFSLDNVLNLGLLFACSKNTN